MQVHLQIASSSAAGTEALHSCRALTEVKGRQDLSLAIRSPFFAEVLYVPGSFIHWWQCGAANHHAN